MVERRSGIASLDASDLPAPLVLRAAWVVTAAPTEISEVEAALTLIVIDDGGGRKTLEVGRWWRKQSTVLEPLEPNGSADRMMFTTSAAFAVTDGTSEPTKGPVTIDILRASNGDIVVATRGPQSEIQGRIHTPPGSIRAKGLASAP